jgi:predicted metal-dependent hydrolase
MEAKNMESLEEGTKLFNEGEHHEAHEAWEAVWVKLKESPEKRFLQGMIMVAASINKYKKKEYAGTEKLLAKGIAYMKDFMNAHIDIDRERFLKDVVSFKEKFNNSRDISSDEFPKIKKM